MKVLLDTHILLWWLGDPHQLLEKEMSLIKEPRNTIYVSSVSAWEISIKKALGKLKAPDNLEEAIRASEFQVLPMTMAHACGIEKLPNHHDDPFDRMLIFQTLCEGLTLLTRDQRIKEYGVRVYKS
ncbi:twitching motility protein PilT [Candidatus Paracaedimonas acanthamoebae]|nr:twitching motility protein PilT [Candidatus Paracaedimonas acanthamoebae]